MEMRKHPLDFDGPYHKIGAPMVRYSKLPFRKLIYDYGCTMAYTPMILSDVFKHSSISRECEFDTHQQENVIVQFAAKNGLDAADAAELVAPHSNGVDINCGCPQRWAFQEGIGSYLMTQPQTVEDIVKQVKQRTCVVKMTNGQSFPCSIKIRVHDDIKETIEMVRRAEKMGVDWITVHGRTRHQRNTEPVNWEGIKLLRESVQVPVMYNGSINSLEDADEAIAKTGCHGVMSARGLLQNPALYAGYTSTPWECVTKYIEYGVGLGSSHFIFHHHLMYMLESSMSRAEKKHFNCLYSIPAILDYFREHYGMEFTF